MRNAAEQHGQGFTYEAEVMFDYDGHLREAYKEEIGNDYKHSYRGCTFHFSNCILNYVGANYMITNYRDKENVILRNTIHAALGISHIRPEDMEYVIDDLRSVFDSLKETAKKADKKIYKFLNKFTETYIRQYWLTCWETSEICFFGDASLCSCEHMTNNALEKHNSEIYQLLGRHPHPNPYYFMACIRNALQRNKKQLALVENGDFVEVRSREARKSALKRQRLKVQFLDRMKRARNEQDRRRARLRYMICAGRTGAKIAKGRKQSKKKSLTTNKTKQSPKQIGRPSYTREKAPQEKKCRHCGKLLASKSGCKNHERICKKRDVEVDESQKCCKHCKKTYKITHYLREHEQKCGKKKDNVKMKSLGQIRKSLLATANLSDDSHETTASDESEILDKLEKQNTSDEFSEPESYASSDSEESKEEKKGTGRGRAKGRGARRNGG